MTMRDVTKRTMLASSLLGIGMSFSAPAQAQEPSGDMKALIEQGKMVAIGADCMACHTVPNKGAPFAGGYGIVSPLGTIFSTNITPSKTAGIGTYTEKGCPQGHSKRWSASLSGHALRCLCGND